MGVCEPAVPQGERRGSAQPDAYVRRADRVARRLPGPPGAPALAHPSRSPTVTRVMPSAWACATAQVPSVRAVVTSPPSALTVAPSAWARTPVCSRSLVTTCAALLLSVGGSSRHPTAPGADPERASVMTRPSVSWSA